MLKYDCRYFAGDKPCKYHKESGIKCNSCDYYYPIEFKILIIKLDAVGDVLRTTSILPSLKDKYPKSHITWCTRKNAERIFNNNDFVNDIITIDEDAFFRLKIEKFDIVINLDTSKFSSAIASSADAKIRMGFLLNESGSVVPTSEAANKWLLMSAFDDVKKENKKSYQQLMYEIIEIDSDVKPPFIYPSEKIRKAKSEEFKKSGLDQKKYTIGLNIGVGTKWPNKGWPIENWIKLIENLKEKNFNLLLLGGKDEKNAMDLLSEKYPFLVNTKCENTINEFAAIVAFCNLVITADTFALHVATALGKKIVAMFGPTSMNEVELFGKGIKLHSDEECKCYYKKNCTEVSSCMQKISAEQVYSALKSLTENMRLLR
jgi:heptosyltransferase-2